MSTTRLTFGGHVLDIGTRQLLRGANEVHLSPKAFDLLHLLAERRPRAVSKADLHTLMWPGTFVTEANLASLVAEVRRALGDPRLDLGPGGFAFGPKGVPHTFIGAAPTSRALVGFQPMQFEGFLREVGQRAPERVLPPPHDGPPDFERLAAVAKRNGFIVLGPPGPPPGR